MALENYNINIELDEIHCRDEGDGWGNAEPYLWTVFFKIDGDTVSLNTDLTLSGTATVVTTPGSHGNLDTNSVDAGDHVSIPSDIGKWQTKFSPIPAPSTLSGLIPNGLPGVIGIICILMEEDNVSDDGAESAHVALNNAVQNALDNIIATRTFTNQNISDEELADFEGDIQNDIINAIQSQQNFFENIWSWVNPDDAIGTGIFFFDHNQIQDGDNLSLSQHWRSEGDWQLNGHMNVNLAVTPTWIGAIRLVVETADEPYAGTDGLVQATIIRDGNSLRVLNLDYPAENDHERDAIRGYNYSGPTAIPRRNDLTPSLPPGIGQIPMPYPGYGFEFSNGLNGHLSIRLKINNSDMWIKDKVDLYVKFIRQVATSFDTLAWQEDPNWTYIASWTQDVSMSTDASEGVTTWNLILN